MCISVSKEGALKTLGWRVKPRQGTLDCHSGLMVLSIKRSLVLNGSVPTPPLRAGVRGGVRTFRSTVKIRSPYPELRIFLKTCNLDETFCLTISTYFGCWKSVRLMCYLWRYSPPTPLRFSPYTSSSLKRCM